MSLDPNVKVDPSSITPQWELYGLSANEMVFNKTTEDVPDIRLVKTNEELLTRCRLVVHPFLHLMTGI